MDLWSLEQTAHENDVLLQEMLLTRKKDQRFLYSKKAQHKINSHHFISELLLKQTCYIQAAM